MLCLLPHQMYTHEHNESILWYNTCRVSALGIKLMVLCMYICVEQKMCAHLTS